MAAYFRSLRTESSSKSSLSLLIVVFALLSLLSGCAKSDLYASCAFSANQTQMQSCLVGQSSCAFDKYIACDTRICAKYKSSEPFCSLKCTPKTAKSVCGSDAVCVPFFPGLPDSMYCVKKDVLDKANKPNNG